MTLREAVADRARWLDTIKPNWEKLVPLEDGKVDMFCCPCLADWVFAAGVPAQGFQMLHALGYWEWRDQAGHCGGAFAFQEAWPMWREEICTRLAKFTPEPIPAEQTDAVPVPTA